MEYPFIDERKTIKRSKSRGKRIKERYKNMKETIKRGKLREKINKHE